MMRSAIQFEDREGRIVCWVPCELTARDMEERATRLRSWALIIGATIAGPAFVTLRGAEGGRICLPLKEWHPAHPETGVTVERQAAGPVARLENATVMDAHDVAQAVLSELGGRGAERGDAEFYPATKGSLTGDLVIPVCEDAVRQPLAVAV
ncbi:MAG: hypothetical protein WD557_16045 [Dehalococcoidia bacterium]